MRLLQSVLATLPQTRKPQRKFITHLLGLVLMLPGHATFRNLSRYSSCHERTFARWYDRPFDFVSLNKAAITHSDCARASTGPRYRRQLYPQKRHPYLWP